MYVAITTLWLISLPVFVAYSGLRPCELLNFQYWAVSGIAEFGSKILLFLQGKHIAIVLIIISVEENKKILLLLR
jgi:hypothetical protein